MSMDVFPFECVWRIMVLLPTGLERNPKYHRENPTIIYKPTVPPKYQKVQNFKLSLTNLFLRSYKVARGQTVKISYYIIQMPYNGFKIPIAFGGGLSTQLDCSFILSFYRGFHLAYNFSKMNNFVWNCEILREWPKIPSLEGNLSDRLMTKGCRRRLSTDSSLFVCPEAKTGLLVRINLVRFYSAIPVPGTDIPRTASLRKVLFNFAGEWAFVGCHCEGFLPRLFLEWWLTLSECSVVMIKNSTRQRQVKLFGKKNCLEVS
ncbi:hypothetical protein HOLleu_37432 [Holothuria leucospilota]|uniref:Uncharacterized protein n=1 Tax=Holothuria leucospilota TaxID=206669 RepID=A0A9Q1BEI3_HOLLE|nr:hypothetical protein HOLleu_37432 [Holothuria leucospilota]